MKETIKGLISSIQCLSTEDGPGIRTTVFLKGCNMQCAWCHNPEALLPEVSLGIVQDHCSGCGKCVPVCPTSALSLAEGKVSIARDRCNLCLSCTKECFFKVFTVSGKKYSVQELVDELSIDSPYFRESGGGVTFSGGEPLLQDEFVLQTICSLEKQGIKSCIQTNLSVPFNTTLEKISEHCDIFYVDLKLFSSKDHQRWTGLPNERIFENLRKLDEKNVRICLRTVVVEGINDTLEKLLPLARFAKSLVHLENYSLIPYHPLGLSKHQQFGIVPRYENPTFFDKNRLQELQKQINLFMGNGR